MDLLKQIKNLMGKSSRKKLIENTAILVIIGVIILIAGKSFFSGTNTADKNSNVEKDAKSNAVVRADDYYDDTEIKLGNILSQINGAGKVEVMVTYSVSKENIPAYDVKKSESTTDEKDSGGGTRKIGQNSYESQIVYENGQNGQKNPMIIKELEPVVKGVLVVAEGATNPEVREKLCKSVQVLMDVPIHKIQVIERKK